MTKRSIFTLAVAASLACNVATLAQELTPEQRAEYRAKAETAARLISYGQKSKDGAMLNAAANLIEEIGPIAKEMKDGKPVNYDVAELRKEAETYGAGPMSSRAAATPMQCSWFYNCDSYNNCFWDQWC